MLVYEKIALKKLLEEKDEDLFLKLKSVFFKKSIHKDIFTFIQNYYDDYSKLPDKDVFLSYTYPRVKLSNYKIMQGLIEGFEFLTIKSNKEIIDNLKKKRSVELLDSKVEELVTASQDKDLDKVKSLVNFIQENLVIEEKSPVDINEGSFEPNELKMIEPFLPSMKEAGLYFTGISVIGGGTGDGKSILLLQQLLYSYKQGENVCLLNLELGYNETIARLYSMENNIPFSKVYNKDGEVTLMKDKVNLWKKEFFTKKNKFYIDNQPYDIKEIKVMIKHFQKKGVEVFGIDYLNLIELPVFENNEWKVMARFIKDLHRLTQELGIVILTPTQVNIFDVKEKDNQIKITARGSRELEFSASVFIFIYRTKEEIEENTARIFTIKARNAQSNVYIAQTDFQHMKFIDTGITL